MRKRDHQRTPDDRTSRALTGGPIGNAETFTSEEPSRADLEKPKAESGRTPGEKSSESERGGQQISGPGPNDLTRGLP